MKSGALGSKADLKKKGLRLLRILTELPARFESRPEKEGIKTFTLNTVAAHGGSKADLKKKGLRRNHMLHEAKHIKFESRPEKEGIKTESNRNTRRTPPFESRPEKEGIKTHVFLLDLQKCEVRKQT